MFTDLAIIAFATCALVLAAVAALTGDMLAAPLAVLSAAVAVGMFLESRGWLD